ncbi:tRNA1(Val) (adenine(37)-N6)-methyltransferase [Cognatishimia activa]|uniref:tRNA1(Val) (Adenine(37)-N6)-methyltransferase n=1 Tax=Cognatishimia activa TaxID=1715691 RepID=A0A0P1J8S4_9RHOB|nr:methyltransferase [Cognatishimia activa]CUJ03842.1 tRNA1(Val) (adenine(37)-N6)-methyltransferase [Cognatishimia activa]CUK26093.1 tRNA1(Val) (adenine(37)-N6)-methyltransferase [Cognatishimia activa]
MTEQTTENAYLGGRVRIKQPSKGYRAGVDPVLLAAAIEASSGQTALELGTGVGTAALCLAARVPGIQLHGVEIQPAYASLARENATLNDADFSVFEADLTNLPQDLKQRRFDHVFANPPYFDRNTGNAATDAGREQAMGEDTPLKTWLEVAVKRVQPKGYVTFIHRAERLGDLLRNMPTAMGSLQVQPFVPRPGRDANLVLVRARHSGRAPLRLHAPIQLHSGQTHEKDAEDYTDRIKSVLRDGNSLGFPA